MTKTEARVERARLQKLLDAYDAGRLADQDRNDRREQKRDATPDRADKVRARIAALDKFIAEPDGA